jgi:hypothetical protein
MHKEKQMFLEQYQQVLSEEVANALGIEIMSVDDYWEDEEKDGDLVALGGSVEGVEEDEAETQDVDIRQMANPEERDRQTKKPIAARTNKLLHNSTIKGLVDEKGDDISDEGLEKLKNQMLKRPENLLKQNEKMKKSRGSGIEIYNFSLPAYQGLFFNESTGTFQVVKTCPSAGQCVAFCYATKGGYIQYENSVLFSAKVMTFLMNDFKGFFVLLKQNLAKALKTAQKNKDQLYIRIHDAGDFYGETYIKAWMNVINSFPEINFYAYTKQFKMFSMVIPDIPTNFVLNKSFGGKDDKLINAAVDKHSSVIPKDVFSDLKLKKKEGKTIITPEQLNVLKDRIAEQMGIDRGSILSYEEMLQKEPGASPYWNVIVMPGEGDLSATRKDVIATLLLFH